MAWLEWLSEMRFLVHFLVLDFGPIEPRWLITFIQLDIISEFQDEPKDGTEIMNKILF